MKIDANIALARKKSMNGNFDQVSRDPSYGPGVLLQF